MLSKQDFFTKHNLGEEDLEAARITWEELDAIARRHEEMSDKLKEILTDFLKDYLLGFADTASIGIHSYRYRIKKTDHLIEKIIRKRKQEYDKFPDINADNYYKYITDLIGIRVLFLYREDWIHFHRYITGIFENNPKYYVEDRIRDFDENETHNYIAERPKAYKRSGDSRIYDSKEIEIISGGIYRSLHYILKYHGQYIEIQGRTLFEEGWGEVDHNIVYPHFQDDEMLNDYSKLLNRLSGMADEMSSYFRHLKQDRWEKEE